MPYYCNVLRRWNVFVRNRCVSIAHAGMGFAKDLLRNEFLQAMHGMDHGRKARPALSAGAGRICLCLNDAAGLDLSDTRSHMEG